MQPSNSPYSPESQRPRIFVSHSRADEERATELYQRLERLGTPWMGYRDQRPGDQWEQITRDAISAADVAIICLSRNSTSRSGYLETETAFILKTAATKPYNFVIPVRFDDSPPPPILKNYLYIDLFV